MVRTFFSIIIILFFLIFFQNFAYADLEVLILKESDLPYNLSPNKYENSPLNYNNSPNKYCNSNFNYSNSNSNYKNSPLAHENSTLGNNRLLFKSNNKTSYIGYYTQRENGLINFFSPKGERLFFSPSKTNALFEVNDGEFCGSIAQIEKKNVLVITEKGRFELLKHKLLPNKNNNSNGYHGIDIDHWIQENVNSGEIIILEDGSMWEIDPIDQIETFLWLPCSSVSIINPSLSNSTHFYILINNDEGQKVYANFLGIQ